MTYLSPEEEITPASLTEAERDALTAERIAKFVTVTDLMEANLRGVNLWGADLTGANLDSADLTGVRLGTAVLTGADLVEANLTRADMSCADLEGANLSDTMLMGVNMSGAFYCDKTIWPAGIGPLDGGGE